MAVVARSGPAQVLAHGEVTTFLGHPLTLDLQLDTGVLAVDLAFVSDEATEGLRVDTHETERGLAFTLVNFDQADGRGSARPVLLGELGDDLLFFHFRVFRFGATHDHTVHYTFYRVTKAEVGWTPLVEAADPPSGGSLGRS